MESAKVGLSEGTRVPGVGEWRYLVVGEKSLTTSGQTRSVSSWLNSFSCVCGGGCGVCVWGEGVCVGVCVCVCVCVSLHGQINNKHEKRTPTNTCGYPLSTVSRSSSPRDSSISRAVGSQAGGSPFVRKQMSYSKWDKSSLVM